jgi:hypothetical protein
MIELGEAMSGAQTSLRGQLLTQAGSFFAAAHASHLDALHAMLEKELWRVVAVDGDPSVTLESLADRQTDRQTEGQAGERSCCCAGRHVGQVNQAELS